MSYADREEKLFEEGYIWVAVVVMEAVDMVLAVDSR